MTREEFGKIAGFLAAGTGKPMNEATAEVYFDCLKDLPLQALQIAARRCIQSQTYPVLPLVGTLRQYAVESISGVVQAWSEGWEEVISAVKRFGYMRKREALESMSPLTRKCVEGIGWDVICDIETDKRSILASQFRSAYEAIAAREATQRNLSVDVRPKLEERPVLRVIGDLAGRLAISDEDLKAS